MTANGKSGRQPYSKRAQHIFAIVQQYPGISPGLLMAKMGYRGNGVESLLCSCENNGYLLTEDAEGRLYPFDPDMWG